MPVMIAETPIAVEFAEVLDHHVEVVLQQGPFGMPGHPNGLPGRETGVDPLELRHLLLLQLADLRGVVDPLDGTEASQLADLLIELNDLLLKVQMVACRQAVVVRGLIH